MVVVRLYHHSSRHWRLSSPNRNRGPSRDRAASYTLCSHAPSSSLSALASGPTVCPAASLRTVSTLRARSESRSRYTVPSTSSAPGGGAASGGAAPGGEASGGAASGEEAPSQKPSP